MTAHDLLFGTGLVMLTLLTACNRAEDELFRPYPALSHYDAASTHLAVLSVASWTDQVDRLQPGFRLDGEAALAKTLPVTQLLTDQLLDALNASLQVALPSFSQTRTETVTREDSGSTPPTETRNVTEEEKSGPGELPALSEDAAAGRKAGDLATLSLDPGRLKREAILEYQTATALFQEVQLLNSYVRDAVRRTGYTPYLVRLQLTVMPNGRNRPYDVLADIGFLPPQKTKEEPGGGGIPKALDRQESFKLTPVVIPLLVTDTVELSLQSRALEILRQFRGALSGQFQNIGVQASLGRTKDEIATALGNDLNAISIVGRLNESTVRVRLGVVAMKVVHPRLGVEAGVVRPEQLGPGSLG